MNYKDVLLGIKWADATGISELVIYLRTRHFELEVREGYAH